MLCMYVFAQCTKEGTLLLCFIEFEIFVCDKISCSNALFVRNAHPPKTECKRYEREKEKVNLSVCISWRWLQINIKSYTHTHNSHTITQFASLFCDLCKLYVFNTNPVELDSVTLLSWQFLFCLLFWTEVPERWRKERKDSVACAKSHHLLISWVSMAILKHYNLSSFR